MVVFCAIMEVDGWCCGRTERRLRFALVLRDVSKNVDRLFDGSTDVICCANDIANCHTSGYCTGHAAPRLILPHAWPCLAFHCVTYEEDEG